MSQAHTHNPKPVQDFRSGLHKVGQGVAEVKSDLSDLARDAASTAKAGVQEVASGVERSVRVGKKNVSQAMENMGGCIAEKPWTAVGVALGVGAVIGFVCLGRTRS